MTSTFDLSLLLHAAAAETGRFVTGDVRWMPAAPDDLRVLTESDRELLEVVTGERFGRDTAPGKPGAEPNELNGPTEPTEPTEPPAPPEARDPRAFHDPNVSASSPSSHTSDRYGMTPKTGSPVRDSTTSRPGRSRSTSPRNLLTIHPARAPRSSSSSNAHDPYIDASTPPRSMSPTTTTGSPAARANPRFV